MLASDQVPEFTRANHAGHADDLSVVLDDTAKPDFSGQRPATQGGKIPVRGPGPRSGVSYHIEIFGNLMYRINIRRTGVAQAQARRGQDMLCHRATR